MSFDQMPVAVNKYPKMIGLKNLPKPPERGKAESSKVVIKEKKRICRQIYRSKFLLR